MANWSRAGTESAVPSSRISATEESLGSRSASAAGGRLSSCRMRAALSPSARGCSTSTPSTCPGAAGKPSEGSRAASGISENNTSCGLSTSVTTSSLSPLPASLSMLVEPCLSTSPSLLVLMSSQTLLSVSTQPSSLSASFVATGLLDQSPSWLSVLLGFGSASEEFSESSTTALSLASSSDFVLSEASDAPISITSSTDPASSPPESDPSQAANSSTGWDINFSGLRFGTSCTRELHGSRHKGAGDVTVDTSSSRRMTDSVCATLCVVPSSSSAGMGRAPSNPSVSSNGACNLCLQLASKSSSSSSPNGVPSKLSSSSSARGVPSKSSSVSAAPSLVRLAVTGDASHNGSSQGDPAIETSSCSGKHLV